MPDVSLPTASISGHAGPADAQLRQGFGPRVRRLHARIGRAHHRAEGMAFSRSLLEGQASPLQLAALIRALAPAYALIERQGPPLAAALGAVAIPWVELGRTPALQHDLGLLAGLPATPASAAAAAWLEQLQLLAHQAPHRFLAHLYVRYGGDLSGGQQLARQADAILGRHGLGGLAFWAFRHDLATLKHQLHQGFEQLHLSPEQEEDLLQEAEAAFHVTQSLLAELADLR